MSLQLDPRTGSGDLLDRLRSRRIPTELVRLEFGDAAFLGNGPDGCPIPVGIEIKQVSDVLKCITDGRFAGHQLPGLCTTYEYRWLCIEGTYRADASSGVLQWMRGGKWTDAVIGSRRFTGRELASWLLTISIKGGMRVTRTYNRDETADFLGQLYNWWCGKEWDEHRSHLACDLSHLPDAALLVRPTLVRLVAKELPGIGWEKAAEVSKKFQSVIEMAVAEADDWRDIPGIGPKTAEKVVRAIRND